MLKLNCEGFESEVEDGAPLTFWGPGDQISVESPFSVSVFLAWQVTSYFPASLNVKEVFFNPNVTSLSGTSFEPISEKRYLFTVHRSNILIKPKVS